MKTRAILIYGAGRGGAIVSEILGLDPGLRVVGFIDDNEKLWGQEMGGHPVLGGVALLDRLQENPGFDALVLSMATPDTMHVRSLLYLGLKERGFCFVNAIHPNTSISPSARIGENNVVSAGVIIGTGARLGDNNRISAHCNIEHHSVVGSHNFFGSHCVTGGVVTIGDDCVFGMGVIIESLLQFGNNVRVASGAVVTRDLPVGSVIGM